MNEFLNNLKILVGKNRKLPKNYIISSSPGSGKTEFAINLLAETSIPAGLKIFLLPYKALAEEVLVRFGQKTDPSRIAISTSDYKESIELTSKDILIATYEKFLYLLTTDKISGINKLVIDEFQLLGKDKRGSVVEQILVHINLFYKDADVLLLSGSVNNADIICNWLNSISTKKYEIIQDDNINSRLTIQISDHDFSDREKNYVINQIIQNHLYHQGLIFFNTKGKAMEFIENFNAPQYDYSTEVDDYCGCIKGQVAFHTSSLMFDERQMVEEKFKSGEIRIISCTPTLAAGVNLPADYVIVADIADWEYKNGNFKLNPKSSGDILQMLGRAGRPQYNKPGYGYVLVSREQKAVFNDYPNFRNKILNKITDSIKSFLVNEKAFTKSVANTIALNTQLGLKQTEIISYLKSTYFYYLSKNITESKIVTIINYLLTYKFICERDNRYFITNKGFVAIRSSMDLVSVEKVYQYFTDININMENEQNILEKIAIVYKNIDGLIDQKEDHLSLILSWIKNEKIKRNGKRPDRDMLTIKDHYRDILGTVINIHQEKLNNTQLEFLRSLYLRLDYGVLKEVIPIMQQRRQGIGRMRALELWNKKGNAEFIS